MAYDRLNAYPGFELPPERSPFPWVNVALFAATVLTTLLVGTLFMLDFDGVDTAAAPLGLLLEDPWQLTRGLGFMLALISILLAHEMGHYLTCRYYRIRATLPYFIPAPTMVGTFGAFIKIRSPFPHRASLFEVGVAGPIAGFVVAVPILLYALTLSRFIPADTTEDLLTLGEPLIWIAGAHLMGAVPPEGMELYVHPIGFAAWVGFLVTALNLLPAGQLDGGHMIYALVRRAHGWISRGVVFLLFPLGIFLWPGWLVWAVLLVLLGTRHPPTLDDEAPLERRQILLAIAGLVIFILCFMPIPIAINQF